MDFRSELIERLKKNREADTSRFLNFISQPKVQIALEAYIKSLKEKK